MDGESLDKEYKTLNEHITDGKTKLVDIPFNLQDKRYNGDNWETTRKEHTSTQTYKHTNLEVFR